MMLQCLLSLFVALPIVKEAPRGQIAFPRAHKIWVVDVETADTQEVSDLPAYDRPLTWSPDGQRVLFWKHSEIGWNFWTVNADGSDSLQLTTTKSGGFRSASYSADGKHIAYMRDMPNGVYVMKSDGTDQRRLTDFGHRDFAPSWSPDGDQLLFFNLTADAERGLKRGLYLTKTIPNTRAQPRYLFGGHVGSFSAARNEIVAIGDSGGQGDIFVVDLGSLEARNLTKSDRDEYSVVWSPSGDEIAFARSAGEDNLEICRISREGDGLRVLAKVPRVSRPAVAWSPDGSHLAFLAEHNDEPALFVLKRDGGQPRLLAEGVRMFAWRPIASGERANSNRRQPLRDLASEDSYTLRFRHTSALLLDVALKHWP